MNLFGLLGDENLGTPMETHSFWQKYFPHFQGKRITQNYMVTILCNFKKPMVEISSLFDHGCVPLEMCIFQVVLTRPFAHLLLGEALR